MNKKLQIPFARLCKLFLLSFALLMSLPMAADQVITFTGSASETTQVYDKVNTCAIYFNAPASQNGASKLVLKSVQIYTFLDGTGSYTNLENQTVYLGVGQTRPTTGSSNTGAALTAESTNSLIGVSAGVTYNSEGYTNFTFTNGLEINPEEEYVFYLLKSTTPTSGFTYYNIRMRVYQDMHNETTNYYGQEGGLLIWMPFYVVTLTDKEEDVTTSLPNPPMTEEEIQQGLEESGGNGTTTRRYVKNFGFTMPNGNGVSSYQTNAVSVYMAYQSSTSSTNYYLVIAKSNIANGTIAADDIIAVSTNSNIVSKSSTSDVNGPGYKTFNFSSTLKFRPNTTYYAYFVTNSNVSSGFTPANCYIHTITKTYRPTVYANTSTASSVTSTSDMQPTMDFWPVFEMQLTKVTASDPFADGELQTLWSSGNNVHPWRIPALARTRKGTLVAFAGYLICDKDVGNGECDIAMKTSLDNGVTWSSAGYAVAEGSGSSGAYDCGYGDAAVVADRESDRLLVMCATGHVTYANSTRNSPIRFARVYGTEGSNGNITWTTPTDVTTAMYAVNTSMEKGFFASGRICQSRVIKTGNYYRLYAALTTNNGNIVVYSDDFGETWTQLGGTAVSGGDEAKIEEMPNGDIFISSRVANGRYFNLFKYTNLANSTTAGSWGTRQTLSLGNGAATNGEILFVNVKRHSDNKNCILALQSMPSEASSTYYPRKKVKIYWREMNQNDLGTISRWTSGWSTSNAYQVSYSGSAYSTMMITPDQKIGFMLENNYFDVGGEPRSDIQYVNLPISTITNGAYTDIISEYVLPYRESFASRNSDMRFDKITLQREDMTNGERYYTLCVPFDMTADEVEAAGLTAVETLREYVAANDLIRFMDVEDGIEAFKPYAVKGSNTSGITLEQKNVFVAQNAALIPVESNGATFTGNLVEEYNLSQNGTVNAYGYTTSGDFKKASATAKIHAYCAYLTLPAATTVKSLAVSFGDNDDEPTSINGLFGEEDPMQADVIYNLAGQRVSKGYKGIIIVNGKKYLMK